MKSSDIKGRAQPGAQVSNSGHFFLQCSGLSNWLEKLVPCHGSVGDKLMQELYFSKESKNLLLPKEAWH